MDFYDKLFKYKTKYLQKMVLGLVEKDLTVDDKLDYYSRLTIYDQLTNGQLFSKNDCKIITKRQKSGTTDANNNYQYITRGGMGEIYFFYITTTDKTLYEIALKIQKFKPWQLQKKNFKSPFINIWKELYLLNESVQMVQSRVTQNLPLTYWYRICKNDNDTYLMLYNELFDGNLKQWLQENHSIAEWKSFLFQIWHTVYLFGSVMNMVHYDYRILNILFKRCKPGGHWKYTMKGNDYYVPNEGSVFIAWDFASADLMKYPLKSRDIIQNHIDSHKDLFFVHELYKRIRVLSLMESYSLPDIEAMFTTSNEIKYMETNKKINKERFDEERFLEKYKISLIYYIIENNKFNDLYNATNNNIIKLPPTEIDSLLKELNDNYNVQYKDALSKRDYVKSKTLGPIELINKFLPEFKIEKSHLIHFTS